MAKYESFPVKVEAHKRLTGVAGRDALLIFLNVYDPKRSYWKCNPIPDHITGKPVCYQFWVTGHDGMPYQVPEGYYIIRETPPLNGFFALSPIIFKMRYKKL